MLSQDDNAESDPFDHAHPSLVRCLEQATMELPCEDEVMNKPAFLKLKEDVMWDANTVPVKPLDGFGKGIQDTAWLSWF